MTAMTVVLLGAVVTVVVVTAEVTAIDAMLTATTTATDVAVVDNVAPAAVVVNDATTSVALPGLALDQTLLKEGRVQDHPVVTTEIVATIVVMTVVVETVAVEMAAEIDATVTLVVIAPLDAEETARIAVVVRTRIIKTMVLPTSRMAVSNATEAWRVKARLNKAALSKTLTLMPALEKSQTTLSSNLQLKNERLL